MPQKTPKKNQKKKKTNQCKNFSPFFFFSQKIFFFCENNRKSDKIMHCVDFFFFFGFFLGFFWAFLTNFAPNLSIYHQNYVKNGYIFKTVNQIFFFSTQCIILLLFLVFSQIKIGGTLWAPPPPSKLRSENTPSKVRLTKDI